MKFIIIIRFLLLIVLVFPVELVAQGNRLSKYFDVRDTMQVHVLQTKNKDVFRGRVIDIKGNKIAFLTKDSIAIDFDYKEIKSIKVEGKDLFINRRRDNGERAYPQKLFYHSTAFSLRKEEMLYNNVDILWNSIDKALGKGFTIGASTVLPVLLSAKIEYKKSLLNDKLHIGVSTNVLTFFYDAIYDFSDRENFMYIYGIASIGSPKFHVNITAGVLRPILEGNENFEYSWENYLTSLGFGGLIGKHFSYQSEIIAYRTRSWNNGAYIIGLAPSFSLGWQGQRSRFDFGFLSFPDVYFEFFPYLSYKIQI